MAKSNGSTKGAALFETMAQQVAAECDRLTSEARREADVIVAEARDRADKARRAALQSTEDEMRLLEERWRLKAEAEASKAALSVKNDGVEDVLGRVRGEIRSLVESGRFPAVLDALLGELMTAAEPGVTVLAPESHTDHVRRWLESHGHGGVSVEGSPEVWDGVAVQDPGKTYRISNTLTGRFNRVQEEARRICMTRLFDTTGAV